jgi:hypothetical protein
MGLLQDDEEWIQCLVESSLFMMAIALRMLFAIILYKNQPTDPLSSIWNSEREGVIIRYKLSEGHQHQRNPDSFVQDESISCCLANIHRILKDCLAKDAIL